MEDIRVAAVTMNGVLGEPGRNVDRIAEWCQMAKAQGAELVVFPELVVHGHCAPNTWDLAEPVPQGASTQRLCAIARELGLILAVGLSEKECDIVYNAQVLVGPLGYIGKQRKLHLSRDEAIYYKGGTDLPVFDIGKCRVATIICYDNLLPEPPRIAALRGADVLLMPHAARRRMWGDTPESEAAAVAESWEEYTTFYPLRARENACFAIVADQTGRAGSVKTYPANHPNQPHHAGGAFIFAPNGKLLAAAKRERIEEAMAVADLPANLLSAERSHPNYTLRTRRPELFEELVRNQVSC